MKALPLLPPALALGAAALLVAPGSVAEGYSLNGSSLGVGQRDFRLFNNFADPTANDNMTTKLMFPGALGAEQAVWKGTVEWSSTTHGTGLGDPEQQAPEVVGSGGADFDPAWMGNATGVGGSNDNIVSTISSCGSGILAFAEGPYSNGWRIRFCENQTFDDGPWFIGSRFDLQAIQAHEYGHVLGLGHSGNAGATMAPSIGAGSKSERSINNDDKAGVQAIYGVISSGKPTICKTEVSGSELIIEGRDFDPTANDIWFRPLAATSVGSDPRIRVLGVASTEDNTKITVTIPAGAAPGDILVKTSASGGASLSNPFPADLDLALAGGTLFAPNLCTLSVASMTPTTIESLDPGTAQTVTLSGVGMNSTTSIEWNSTPVPSSRWTIVDATTITIDMPQGGVLGAGNTLELSDGSTTSTIDFTVVEPATPKLELGTGDPLNATANGQQMNVILAGKVGTVHQVWFSKSNLPSNHALANWLLGNNFSDFRFALARTIGPDGYHQSSPTVTFSGMSSTVFYCQSIDLTTPPSPQYGVSNLQSITLTP